MSDLIDRQAAIDAVVSAMIDGADAELVEGIMEMLPSAQPRHKKGRWIIHRDWIAEGECGYECSECGRCYDYDMNYCGHCGAKMEVEHDE